MKSPTYLRLLRNSWTTLAATILSSGFMSAHAQFALDWHSVDGGGGFASGGQFQIEGTVGQPDAATSTARGRLIQGGFWAVAYTLPSLHLSRSGNSTSLWWTRDGFVPQNASQVIGPWSDLSTPVTYDGVRYTTPVSLTGSARFFRLRLE